MEATIELPRLHPAQQKIIDHPARFKVLACGRRFGKTQVALDSLVNHLLDGHLVAYFAPSEVMTGEVWEAAKKLLHPLIARVRENEKRMEMLNDGLFECWTARSEAVRGRSYHMAVIDEAALIPTADIWQATIRPLLTDHQGHALFASTPRGQNWFWDCYNLGQDPQQTNWQSWQFPTVANPYIDPAEIEDARHNIPQRVFQQEYLAAFLEDGGSVFRNIDRACTANALLHAEPGSTYVMGIDWARDRDFTVVSVMDKHQQRQVFLDRFNQISYNIQRNRIAAHYQRFQPAAVVAEANSMGAVNIDALREDGIPVRGFYTTAQKKAELIDRLVLAMEKEQITLLNDSVLKHELRSYQMARSPSGFWQYSAPPGGHDDTVIATALSYWAVDYTSGVLIAFV